MVEWKMIESAALSESEIREPGKSKRQVNIHSYLAGRKCWVYLGSRPTSTEAAAETQHNISAGQ